MKEVRGETLLAKDKKLREIVLYISERCQGDETFGSAKLI